MKLDPRSHVPLYLQIAAAIRQAVAAGVYRTGDALPSLRAMALEAHVNPNTVQRAYDHLAREGLIAARRGQGLFVTEQAISAAQSRAHQAVRRHFEQGVRTGHAAGIDMSQLRAILEEAITQAEAGER